MKDKEARQDIQTISRGCTELDKRVMAKFDELEEENKKLKRDLAKAVRTATEALNIVHAWRAGGGK